MASTEVVVSDAARSLAARRGGVVDVRSHAHRCCAGRLTLLDTSTDLPTDADDFVDVPTGDVMVRYRANPEFGPHVLTVELRGTFRRRLVSFWDGCAFEP